MSNQRIKELLDRLQDEINKTEPDEETRKLASELDADIHKLIAPDAEQADTSRIVERAKALEANFATEYPAAERFMREVIDALVRMGI